ILICKRGCKEHPAGHATAVLTAPNEPFSARWRRFPHISLSARLRRAIFGAPKDVKDPHAFHKLSLVALLAWVGLGSDGLSSSAYGPDEAFRALVDDSGRPHIGLAVFLAVATALTVFIISYGYSR